MPRRLRRRSASWSSTVRTLPRGRGQVGALRRGSVDAAAALAAPDGSGRLAVRRSKTDQDGRGAVLYVGPATVEAVEAWRKAAGVEDALLFRCSERTVRRAVVKRAAAAGVSEHSLRVGSGLSLWSGPGLPRSRVRPLRTCSCVSRAWIPGGS